MMMIISINVFIIINMNKSKRGAVKIQLDPIPI